MMPRALFACLGLLAVSACSSGVGEVALKTTPANAHCLLTGQDGYAAAADTPAAVRIPLDASPVVVHCQAPGFRPAEGTLEASTDHWVMLGSALSVVANGSLALVGLADTPAYDDGERFQPGYNVEMTPIVPRAVRLRQRDGRTDLITP